MKNKLPTFEECMQIVEANECFTHRYRYTKDGQKVSVFDYLMASYQDFARPLGNSELTAFELRGLCFTHNEDGSVAQRFLMLHKFFNLNQCENYQYQELKDVPVLRVMDKMDGSVMRFIRLPNGKTVVKSKTFFDNDMTTLAEAYYKANPSLQAFVEETLDQGLAAIFELTSPHNQVVLKHNNTKLTLLQLRNEENGEYLDVYNHELVVKHGIEVAKKCELTLDEALALAETVEGIEGWIFVNTQGMFKLKTKWYCDLHGLYTDYLSRENKVLEMLFKNTIDDVLAKLEQTDPRKAIIEEVCKAYTHYMAKTSKELAAYVKEHYKGNKKEWAMAHLKYQWFAVCSKLIDVPDESREELALARLKDFWARKLGFSSEGDGHLTSCKEFFTRELNQPLLIQGVCDEG